MGILDIFKSQLIDVIEWKDDPKIGKVQPGYYKRVGIAKGDMTYEEMLELNERTISSYLGLNPEDFRDGRFYLCANNLKADEIWLVELENEDAVQKMMDKARERIQVKASSYELYLPEESEIARRGVVVAKGNYLALFLSPDAERMRDIFLASLDD